MACGVEILQIQCVVSGLINVMAPVGLRPDLAFNRDESCATDNDYIDTRAKSGDTEFKGDPSLKSC